MNAKEMFEKLGYYPSYDYNNPKNDFAFYEADSPKMIVFNLKNKDIEVYDGNITIEDLQAINQQVRELGWLDE